MDARSGERSGGKSIFISKQVTLRVLVVFFFLRSDWPCGLVLREKHKHKIQNYAHLIHAVGYAQYPITSVRARARAHVCASHMFTTYSPSNMAGGSESDVSHFSRVFPGLEIFRTAL